jgi:hypothetical protein
MTRFNYAPAPLGSGGFGIVHAATRTDDEGNVVEDSLAIKFLKPEWCDNEEALARFQREVRLQQEELDHPHVLPIVGRNLSANPPYFVMPQASHSLRVELVDGLAEDEDTALEYFEQILTGMAHAHEREVLHRDLKPENVLFVDGVPRVADFGLGKRLSPDATNLTRTEVWFGTEAYMAPEQRSATKHVTASADVYSLGKMLGELLTGAVPQPFVFSVDAMPMRFRYFLNRCCDQDPGGRYQNAGEMLAAFRVLTAPDEVVDPPIEGAEKLVQQWMAGDHGTAVITALNEHFMRYRGEEELYSRVVPYLPDALIQQYLGSYPDDARELLKVFDGHIGGSLPFSYCDVIADFYATIFPQTTDGEIRKLILARLWQVGPTHNRWHVGQVFARLIGEIKDPSDALLAIEVIAAAPNRAHWHEDYLKQVTVLRAVSGAVAAAVAEVSSP